MIKSLLLIVLLFLSQAATAAIILVGPNENITRIADAARVAKDGDTVLIMPGEYRGDVAVWTQKKLTIRGRSERPVLIADGKSAEGKGIWVIRNGSFLIENIEFRNARVPDGNGAGIRLVRGVLHVKNCAFVDNQMGLMTADFDETELTIEDSLFVKAPKQKQPHPHLLYVGKIAKLQVTGSRFHQGHTGHLIKSRARENNIRYNLIYDGPAGSASYELEFPNGGIAYVVGNVIGQSAKTDNRVLVAYGAEGWAWPDNVLYISHNTLLSDQIGAWFLRVWPDRFPDGIAVKGINNLTVGVGVFTQGVSGEFEANFPALPSMLNAPDMLNFTLPSNSILRGRGIDLGRSLHPDLVPRAEFKLPIGIRPIDVPAQWTPGAFQTQLYGN
jgi:hypothetical protein